MLGRKVVFLVILLFFSLVINLYLISKESNQPKEKEVILGTCLENSENLYPILENKTYTIRKVTGYVDWASPDVSHAWLEIVIPIEGTGDLITNYSSYHPFRFCHNGVYFEKTIPKTDFERDWCS